MSEAPGTPPGQRKVVVLRQGPPKHRGLVVDAVAGVVGIALIVFAGVLGEVLPEPDFVPIQYLPEFNTTTQDAVITYQGETYRSILFRENAAGPTRETEDYELEFEVLHDNVFQARIQVLVEGDDVPGSDTDSWRFTLYDLHGDPLSTPKPLRTKPAIVHAPDTVVTGGDPRNLTTPQPSELNEAWRWTSAPDPEFIDGNNLTPEEAQLLASERYTIPTKGMWKIVMHANNAGDCPPQAPTADPAAMQAYIACYDAADNSDPTRSGLDHGNPLIIRGISYDYYTIGIMED